MTLLLSLAVAAATPGAPAPSALELRALEFRFILRDPVVRAGEVTILVRNEGQIEHNFLLDDGAGKHLAEMASILPGKAEQERVVLRPGRYPFYCNLPGHKDAGMVGMLTVQE